MAGSQASSATSHPLTPEGPTCPAQTLATIMLPQVPPSEEAAHSPRGATEQPPAPDARMLLTRSARGYFQPARALLSTRLTFPTSPRSFQEGAFHQGECGGSALPLPKPTSHRTPFQVAPLLLHSQSSSQELHHPLPWAEAGAVSALEIPNTAGHCRRWSPPGRDPANAPALGYTTPLAGASAQGGTWVADATATVPRAHHGPLDFGQSRACHRSKRPPQAQSFSPQCEAGDRISHPTGVPPAPNRPPPPLCPRPRGTWRSRRVPGPGLSPGVALADPSPSPQYPRAEEGAARLGPPPGRDGSWGALTNMTRLKRIIMTLIKVKNPIFAPGESRERSSEGAPTPTQPLPCCERGSPPPPHPPRQGSTGGSPRRGKPTRSTPRAQPT